MNPDDLKQAWQSQTEQTRVTLKADLLLTEVQRNERNFAATILRRDIVEVGTALVMIPIWVVLGVSLSLPWAWYLTILALLWIAGFMLVDRKRHQQAPAQPGETLRHRVECSLAQVKHQAWLLRNVFWWYLLPPTVTMLAFFGQIAWLMRAQGWESVVAFCLFSGIVLIVYFGIYCLNQYAVRTELEPRCRELQAILDQLEDEPPSVTTS